MASKRFMEIHDKVMADLNKLTPAELQARIDAIEPDPMWDDLAEMGFFDQFIADKGE